MFKVKLFSSLCPPYSVRPVIIMTKDVELSFVPFVGLEYKSRGKIEKVKWTGDSFEVDLADLDCRSEFGFEDTQARMKEQGWTVGLNF